MDESGAVLSGHITLPAVADLVEAGPLKAQIEQHLVAGSGLQLDASAVQRISSPCLQVLVAGVTAFSKAGGPSLVIAEPSPAFLETATALGLGEALRLG
jgi:chemotaxis protein CheX